MEGYATISRAIDWMRQWKLDDEARAKFDAKPHSYQAPYKTKLGYCIALVTLALLSTSAMRHGIYHKVPWTQELQQTYDLYQKAPLSWQLSHPWDPEKITILRSCPPGCPCLCGAGGCIPVCGK